MQAAHRQLQPSGAPPLSEPLFRCTGCGAEVLPDRAHPLPLRCPRAGDARGDVDHVLSRVRPPGAIFPPAPPTSPSEHNPFIRYRALSAAHALAMREGLGDDAFVALVRRVDAAIAAVDGHGFRVTPLARADARGAELWVKDETGNVSGSHKARHLMGILLYLEVARALGFTPGDAPRFAIASCGNAALAAAIVARAAERPLDVFIPPDASARVVARLEALGARIQVCARTPQSPPGDPCYHAFRDAVAHGALPLSCQGGDNGLTIDGGETLAYELAEQLAERGTALDALFVQVGGGALASSLVQGLRVAHRAGTLTAMPRIFTVQTRSVSPLARAHARIADRLVARADARAHAASPVPAGASARAAWLTEHAGAWIDDELAYAATHAREFMWPWECSETAGQAPKSVAHGILDDEAYDWLSVVRGMLETGGHPILVSEEMLRDANRLAREATGLPVDATGSAGLAGLLALRAEDASLGPARAGVIFSGHER
jgi:threonine synthase